MNELKFQNTCLILGQEFTKYEYNCNEKEKRYSIIIISSLSTTQFQRLIQEGVNFYYDGKNLVLI